MVFPAYPLDLTLFGAQRFSLVIRLEGQGYGRAGRGRSHSPSVFCSVRLPSIHPGSWAPSPSGAFLSGKTMFLKYSLMVLPPWLFLSPLRLYGYVVNMCAVHTAVHMRTAVQVVHCIKSTQAGCVCDSPGKGCDSKGERSCFQDFPFKSLGTRTRGI